MGRNAFLQTIINYIQARTVRSPAVRHHDVLICFIITTASIRAPESPAWFAAVAAPNDVTLTRATLVGHHPRGGENPIATDSPATEFLLSAQDLDGCGPGHRPVRDSTIAAILAADDAQCRPT